MVGLPSTSRGVVTTSKVGLAGWRRPVLVPASAKLSPINSNHYSLKHQSTCCQRTSTIAHFQQATDARVHKRQAELATRRMYLTHFWYAATFARELSSTKPFLTKLLDTNMMIWKDPKEARVICVTATCPLTGISLTSNPAIKLTQYTNGDGERATAIVLDNGTQYDAKTGLALDAALAAADVRLEVWDCVEKGGFVWLFFGDKDTPVKSRPAIPWVPELNQPGWKPVHGEVYIKANHWTVIENVIDMAHVPYVHKGTVGNHAAFVDIVIKATPTAMNFTFPIENHKADGEEAKFRVDTQATACLPSTSFIRFKFPWNIRLVTINSVVPIDTETTCIRFCQMRNFLQIGLLDPMIEQGMRNILGEDREILEQLTPNEVNTELSLKADAPQLTLRRMRERYINAGSAVHPGPRPLHGLPKWNDELAERLLAASKKQGDSLV